MCCVVVVAFLLLFVLFLKNCFLVLLVQLAESVVSVIVVRLV